MAQWQGAHVKEDLRLQLHSREFSDFSRAEAMAYAGLSPNMVCPVFLLLKFRVLSWPDLLSSAHIGPHLRHQNCEARLTPSTACDFALQLDRLTLCPSWLLL